MAGGNRSRQEDMNCGLPVFRDGSVDALRTLHVFCVMHDELLTVMLTSADSCQASHCVHSSCCCCILGWPALMLQASQAVPQQYHCVWM
jgi:hypothetical protein